MSELSDLYPALAAVAAITTAIQTPIALDTFSKCSKIVKKLDPVNDREESYRETESERPSTILENCLLNIPATIVNACVIIPWGYLVYSHPLPADGWLYFIPWLGVAVAAIFLFLLVAASVIALWTQWLWSAIVVSIVGILAICLMVAGEVHSWPF